MAKKITIYTRSTCEYCDKIKKYLNTKGHDYNIINLDQEPQRQQEALKLSGALTVPITVVENEDQVIGVVVGFNLQRLVPILTS